MYRDTSVCWWRRGCGEIEHLRQRHCVIITVNLDRKQDKKWWWANGFSYQLTHIFKVFKANHGHTVWTLPRMNRNVKSRMLRWGRIIGLFKDWLGEQQPYALGRWISFKPSVVRWHLENMLCLFVVCIEYYVACCKFHKQLVSVSYVCIGIPYRSIFWDKTPCTHVFHPCIAYLIFLLSLGVYLWVYRTDPTTMFEFICFNGVKQEGTLTLESWLKFEGIDRCLRFYNLLFCSSHPVLYNKIMHRKTWAFYLAKHAGSFIYMVRKVNLGFQGSKVGFYILI